MSFFPLSINMNAWVPFSPLTFYPAPRKVLLSQKYFDERNVSPLQTIVRTTGVRYSERAQLRVWISEFISRDLKKPTDREKNSHFSLSAFLTQSCSYQTCSPVGLIWFWIDPACAGLPWRMRVVFAIANCYIYMSNRGNTKMVRRLISNFFLLSWFIVYYCIFAPRRCCFRGRPKVITSNVFLLW